MRILSAERMAKEEYRKYATGEGDGAGTWSVRYEGNSYMDDCYKGTYEQALKIAQQLKREGQEEVQIALIILNKDGHACYTNDLVIL
jgi:hypothetical protein